MSDITKMPETVREKTPTEISQEFLEAYKELVLKYKRDFQNVLQIVEIKEKPTE